MITAKDIITLPWREQERGTLRVRAIRILVVDDDPAIRRLLQRLLQQEGYIVDVAGDGQAALARIREEQPDLLLLDLMMPVMDGWNLYGQLRTSSDTHFPVIIMTAGERIGRARQDFPDAEVVAKPFDIDYLLQLIRQCLQLS